MLPRRQRISLPPPLDGLLLPLCSRDYMMIACAGRALTIRFTLIISLMLLLLTYLCRLIYIL